MKNRNFKPGILRARRSFSEVWSLSKDLMISVAMVMSAHAASPIELPSVPTPPEQVEYQEPIEESAPADSQPDTIDLKNVQDEKNGGESTAVQQSGAPTSTDRIRPAKSLETLSIDEAIAYLEPLIRAESEDQIVVSMKNLSLEKARQILEYIIESSLPTDLKVQIILGVSLYYEQNKSDQYSLFSLVDSHEKLSQEVPLIFAAAQGSYPQLIVNLLEWKPDQKKQMIDDALLYAVKMEDLDLFKVINKYAQTFDAHEASQFLWLAIDQKLPIEFIRYFIEQGGDLEQEKDGKSLLILAVERLNKPVIELIIAEAQKDAKRDINKMVNRFVDVHVGTPLQIVRAIERDTQRSAHDKKIAAEIEVFLRAQGAAENKK